MSTTRFNEMEIDAIGEIMNISLGASATTVSTLLGSKVNITTPVVQVKRKEEFDFHDLEPAVGVEISYVTGINGKSIMLFSRNDVRIIVSTMMGADISAEEFVMDEINTSAIREVMNQMMGASATALSEFLGTTVNISTPISYEINDGDAFKDKCFKESEVKVAIRFTLEIEGKLKSEFINIMSVDLVKRLLEPFKAQYGLTEEAEAEIPDAYPESTVAEESAESGSAEAPMDRSGAEAPMEVGSAENSVANSAEAPVEAKAETQEEVQKEMHEGIREEILQRIKKRKEEEDSEKMPVPQDAGSLDPTQSDVLLDSLLHGGTGENNVSTAYEGTANRSAESSAQSVSGESPFVNPGVNGFAGTVGSTMQTGSTGPTQGYPEGIPAGTPMMSMPQGVEMGGNLEPMTMQLINQMQQSQNQMMELIRDMKLERDKQNEANIIRPLNSKEFQEDDAERDENASNRELLMKVPLEISVEIGRTRKLVKDILEFTQGSLVVLDKMAGEQADLYVNGECIAKGDIVVVEDNFGIRVTEILKKDINEESL
ncbi:flagellar motor switch protein FliN [Oribacterium parvum]|uniref:flagellar motor switch protein FliN n=1 Tax=Oribacterium parvum TaxID=1501329 RepID=UPI0028F0C1FD|nr:flagellar motor switch protein FliN [Oribacterium parvum]